jgi:hypothetical protein
MNIYYIRGQGDVELLRRRFKAFTLSHLAGSVGTLLWPYEAHSFPLPMATILPTGALLRMTELWEPRAHSIRRWVDDGGDRIGLLPNYDNPAVFWLEDALDKHAVDELRRRSIPEEIAAGVESYTSVREAQMEVSLESRLAEQADFWQLPTRPFKVALQLHGTDLLVPDCWLVEDEYGVPSYFWAESQYWHQQHFEHGVRWQERGVVSWLVEEDQNSHPFTRSQFFEVKARNPSQAVELIREKIIEEMRPVVGAVVY